MTDRSIVTLNEAKDFLGIVHSNTNYDDQLESWIDLSSGYIEQRISDKVAPQSSGTLILDGSGHGRLELPWSGIALEGTTTALKLANLQYRDDVDEAWTDLTADINAVEFDGKFVELLDDTFPLGRKNIRIVYEAGFNPKPADLVEVCLERVADTYFKSQGRFGKSADSLSMTGSGQSNTYTDPSKRWEEVFARYQPPKATVSVING